MIYKRDSIDRMRIASPCPMNWNAMTGDERARFCDACSLHVYNIAEMTTREVETLISKTEGRFCARLYKRSDGTVLTKDCPVGLRAIRRHISRVAGATITAIFSFCMSVMGQSSTQEDKSCPSNSKVTIEHTHDNQTLVRGVITDANGAVIPGVSLKLVNRATQQIVEIMSNEDGTFKFLAIEVGFYDLRVNAAGFGSVVIREVNVDNSEAVNVDVQMLYEGDSVIVGIFTSEPLPETEGPGLKKTYNTKQITSLPF